ncbi:adenosine deaminase family protein [Ralstonia solanacearum]|uniref:adenosine deaminase family protein n=1 Tax=Ralstonia solanacearum TaxID=305 RepID=UPI0001D97BC7|nr:adenosine deaminase [Ralstonia solanacearum]CBJ52318.1 Putative adenosine deaminase (add) [Ralstonia solanacearum PSI07]
MYRNQQTLPLFEGEHEQRTQLGGGIDEPGRPIDKGELHVHLNGAMPAGVILAILAEEGTNLPDNFQPERDLVRRSPCASLSEYLKPWQLLRRLPKRRENLQRLVSAAVDNLNAHGVRFVELRSSVLYLAALQECSVPEALFRLLSCVTVATQPYAMQWGLVLTVSRGDYSAVQLAALLTAYEALGRPNNVVGIDLAGDEEIPYPVELPCMFRKAKDDYGLGVTIHAGETGNPENVRAAVELFDADRIGHGTAAGNDPRIMELLAKRDICVEVCPISNRLTGAVPPAGAHPLREFQANGVPFVICSDNPAIHERGLTDDYAAALAEGIAPHVLDEQYRCAKRYSFVRGIA